MAEARPSRVLALVSVAAAASISGCHILYPFTLDEAASDGASADGRGTDQAAGDAFADARAGEGSVDAPIQDASALCGNGKIDPGEVCDDGNSQSGDLCSGCKTFDPLCTVDNLPVGKLQGTVTTDPASDIVPLCDGWILLGSTKGNEVQLLNAISGKVYERYPLQGMPGQLELDPQTGVLLVTLVGKPELVKIDLKSGTQASQPLTQPALSVAVGSGGDLFVTLEDPNAVTASRPLVRISPSGQVTPADTKVYQLLAFDSKRGHLITAQQGLSPSSLAVYDTSGFPPQLTLLASVPVGSMGEELALSPDNDHLVLICGGGNIGLPPYSVADYSAGNPLQLQGMWLLGAYPQSAAFSPDSQRLAATNRKKILVFSVASYSVLATETPSDPSCTDSPSIQRVGYSRGGKLFFGHFGCTTSTTARLYWAVGP